MPLYTTIIIIVFTPFGTVTVTMTITTMPIIIIIINFGQKNAPNLT